MPRPARRTFGLSEHYPLGGSAMILIALGVIAVVIVAWLLTGIKFVHSHEVGVLEILGRFKEVRKSGPCFAPKLTHKLHRASTSVQQGEIPVRARTKNGATIDVLVYLEYAIIPEEVQTALFRLANPKVQLRARTEETVKTLVGAFDCFEDAANNRPAISTALEAELVEYATKCGYNISRISITQIDPDADVLAAMRMQDAQERQLKFKATEATAKNDRDKEEAQVTADIAQLNGQSDAAKFAALAEAVRDAAKKLEIDGRMSFDEALKHVLRAFEIDSTRAGIAAANNSFVTVGPANLAQAIAAGTKAAANTTI